jgi:DMSO reductase anchor subunit
VKPALSIILFTTLAGAAQGLVVVVAAGSLLGVRMPAAAVVTALCTALVMLVAALVASFFHLGHPGRAWRTVLMWRTSWMSREVIVLPAFIAVVAAWAAAVAFLPVDHALRQVLPVLAIVGAFCLWWCTAMIYACLRFIQEWAHPLTVVNYTLMGLASGVVLAGAMAVLARQPDLASGLAAWAIGATLLAWFTRGLSLRRNARLKPRSDLQSATGIRHPQLVQKSMGMTGGSFNTREFFHGASVFAVRSAKLAFQLLGFALPALLVAASLVHGASAWWLLAVPVQFAGLLAERWFFFAQARHPQNLYYQTVS